MRTNEPSECIELTSEQLFGLLANLPEDASAEETDLPRRRCCRWLLRAPAELHYNDPAGTQVSDYVDVRDISIQGVGLLCKAPVPVGIDATLVLPLEAGRYRVSLKTAHSTETPEGHRIGCQLLLPDMPTLVPMIDTAMLSPEELEGLGL